MDYTNFLATLDNRIIKVSLADKLLSLIILKYASLDYEGVGLEMYADKPGWNDACNGLPGLFGSSTSELIELIRLINFYLENIDHISSFKCLEALKVLFDGINKIKSKEDRWDITNTLREQYEEEYRLLTNEVILNKDIVKKALSNYLNILKQGYRKALKLGKGIIPTYFTYDVEVVNGKYNFTLQTLPHFLESPARGLKLGKEYVDPKKVNKSQLWDKKLKIFKTSESLENVTNEIGRITSFEPGWLERESDFLHMNFKYLLGLLKAGYYEEFFTLVKTNLPCFMSPEKYGRSIFENVSFIVPSNHPINKYHGRGYYARLTGANTEIVEMFNIIFLGEKIFKFTEGQLQFSLKPKIPLCLFDENGELEVSLFNHTIIKYINKNHKDFKEQNNLRYIIDNVEYINIPSHIAEGIRNKKFTHISVKIL